MDLESIAAELSTARRTRSYVDPPSVRHADFSIGDGYAVGALVHANALRGGYTQRGVKLGFTNPAAWDALGVEGPFWAPIYAETVTDRHELSLEPFVEPRLEPEIVVGLSSSLSRGAGRDDVAA